MSDKSSCLRAFIYLLFLGSWNNYFLHIYSCTNAHANQTKRICPRFSIVIIGLNMGQHMRFSYLSHRRRLSWSCASVQTRLSLALCTQSQRRNENWALLYLCRVFLYINVSMLTNVQWEAKETKSDIYLWRQTSLQGSPDWSWSLLSNWNIVDGLRNDFYPIPSLYTSYDWVVSLTSCKRYPIFGPGFLYVTSRAFLGSSDLTTRVRR